MSLSIKPETPRWEPVPSTEEKLDYAHLPIIDLSSGQTAEGRKVLAGQVRDAMATHGFLYVVNHGYSAEQNQRMMDIADIPFARVRDELKKKYEANLKELGSYLGYKSRTYWHINNGVWDQMETYSMSRDPKNQEHPDVVHPFLHEIEAFAKHNHFNVLYPILRLLALGLELEEDALVKLHSYDSLSATQGAPVRFMKYYPRSEEDEAKAKGVWLKGHTDYGTVSILWSQPVAGLQILTKDGSWKWVRHIDNALVINAGDALEFLSGGYYKATIHRVVQPPADQREYCRLGMFYFCGTDEDMKLDPLLESPVLQRLGISKAPQSKTSLTMGQWRKARTAGYGKTDLKVGDEKGVELEEIVPGVLVKHYN